MANVQLTNYELNKQAYLKVSPLTDKQIQEKQKELSKWVVTVGHWPLHYAGLLCREVYDFTIFHIERDERAAAASIIDTLRQRGEILDIDRRTDEYGTTWQCWVRAPMTTEDIDLPVNAKDYGVVRMYMLFDATDWVVKV